MPSATIIDALPTFISPEEHRAAVQSTPSSFSDIPPVLRHEEKDISVSFDPALEGLSHQTGNLYIAERYVFFIHCNNVW
jgi:nucleotide-sensitive chloride channel 1A